MTTKRIHNFDYLRIVAAACIVLHHYQQVFSVFFEDGLNFYGGKIIFGYIVELFFILSGFLCVSSKKHDSVIKNVIRKIIRFFPYTFLATFCYISVFFIYKAIYGEDLMEKTFSILNIVFSLLLVHQGWIVEFAPAVNNPTWYLCVLIILYILFYTIEFICDRFVNGFIYKIVLYCCIVMMGLVGYKLKLDAPFLHLTDFRGYASFFIGVLLFHLCKIISSEKRKLLIGCLFMTLFLVFTIIMNRMSWYLCVLIGFPSLILILENVKQFPSKIGSLFANSSFEVYIWHAPLFYVFVLFSKIFDISLKHDFVEMILMLIFIELISLLIFIYIDKPIKEMISRKKYLSQ